MPIKVGLKCRVAGDKPVTNESNGHSQYRNLLICMTKKITKL